MSVQILLIIIIAYFILLMGIAKYTSKRIKSTSYFDGDKSSPWFLVAFGMIGSGISAVSLVSIPGNVGNNHLYFFQFILGTIVGYLFIAFVLLPIYYKLKLVSIYSYLKERFGNTTYKTGSLFFLVSQSFGAALRLLLSVKILQYAFFDSLHIPYFLTILILLILIWLYTHKSGIKTIVWTDALQSFFLLTVMIVSIFTIKDSLSLTTFGMFETIANHPYSKLFDWNFNNGSNFFKQFISGLLITIALVGLDQSMMQKTLTINNVKSARKNVLAFSFFIAIAQTIFLGLGILLYQFASTNHIPLNIKNGQFSNTDGLYPLLTMHYFGQIGVIAFFIGIVASTFASIDACITALTTSFSYDFMNIEKQDEVKKKEIKNKVLLGVNAVMFIIVMGFWNSQGAIINTIFTIAGYTYGPLLGLYLLGLFSKVQLREKWTPYACILAPLLTWMFNYYSANYLHFDVGFLNILITAMLTILMLLFIKKKL
jgi:Na+/proline symporter